VLSSVLAIGSIVLIAWRFPALRSAAAMTAMPPTEPVRTGSART
jgi:hypothetical protein